MKLLNTLVMTGLMSLTAQAQYDGDLRLDSSNLLQVYYSGEWKGVCDDQFDQDDGEVACRQLGGTYSSHSGSNTSYAYNSSEFWLDGLECNGYESSLASCSRNSWGNEDCGSSEHVALYCDYGSIGNRGGGGGRGPRAIQIDENGVLLIRHQGEWRGVCDDSFDRDDARVACRQMGGTLIDYSTGQYGPSDYFWLDDLNCQGDEAALKDCSHSGLGTENCSSSEHVSVTCDFRGRGGNRPPRGGGGGGGRRRGCEASDGTTYYNGDTWYEVSVERERERVSCQHGGSKYNVYEKLVEKQCNRGTINNTGSTQRGDSVGTEGSCNRPPVRQPPRRDPGNGSGMGMGMNRGGMGMGRGMGGGRMTPSNPPSNPPTTPPRMTPPRMEPPRMQPPRMQPPRANPGRCTWVQYINNPDRPDITRAANAHADRETAKYRKAKKRAKKRGKELRGWAKDHYNNYGRREGLCYPYDAF